MMLKRAATLGTHVAGQSLNKFRIAANTLITFRRLGLNVKAIAEGTHKLPGHEGHESSNKKGHSAAAGLLGRSYGVKPGM